MYIQSFENINWYQTGAIRCSQVGVDQRLLMPATTQLCEALSDARQIKIVRLTARQTVSYSTNFNVAPMLLTHISDYI